MAEDSNSRPVPDPVQDQWIPTSLYQQAVQLEGETYPNDDPAHYLSPTACPSHVRNLLPLAKAPTVQFSQDVMMPGFCAQHEFSVGEYWIGQVQIRNAKNQWQDFALVVNTGDPDCNSGHWGGAFLVNNKGVLTPMAWIRSVGDTVTHVELAKNIPDSLGFNDETAMGKDMEFDKSVLMSAEEKEEDVFPGGLFGESLRPGVCKTVLEKLVGVAFAQMMIQEWKTNLQIQKGEWKKPSSGGPALDEMVFCITGTLSMKRGDFVALIEDNGGSVKRSVTKDVTHLISARDDTAKAKKAKESGVQVVTEEDVMEMISLGGAAKESEAATEGADNRTSSDQVLGSMVFSITGSLAMKRADFVALIEENGGVVKGSVTKDVTHLISARDDTAKAEKAKEKGVEILKEEQVMEMIQQSTGGAESPQAPAKKKAKTKK